MAYWETAEERNPSAPEHVLEFARIWKQLPKLVYSRSLEAVEGEHAALQRRPRAGGASAQGAGRGPIGVGGATLAASLTAHGLIDEYRLFVSPVVLGGGTPFFASDTHVDLELVETRTFGSRVVYLRYRRI